METWNGKLPPALDKNFLLFWLSLFKPFFLPISFRRRWRSGRLWFLVSTVIYFLGLASTIFPCILELVFNLYSIVAVECISPTVFANDLYSIVYWPCLWYVLFTTTVKHKFLDVMLYYCTTITTVSISSLASFLPLKWPTVTQLFHVSSWTHRRLLFHALSRWYQSNTFS